MAKLSARGRTQFARVAKPYEDAYIKCVTELSLMSDRKVLKRVKFLKPNGTIDHAQGWSVKGTLKRGVTPEQWLANKLAQGWQKVD